MDSQVVNFSIDIGEEIDQPKAMNPDSTNNQVFPSTVSQRIPGETKGSGTQLAGQKPEQGAAAFDQEWKASRREWLIIIVLATISLMVSLDATILVPILPVSA